jgi:hypothetical protein
VTEGKPKKLNSRWRKGAVRYSTERTVEVTRHTQQADGKRRRETDAVSEPRFIERLHEATGWHRGARVRKLGDKHDRS